MNDDVEIPSGSSFLESKKQEARSRFTSALEDFKKILSDKTHPDNQTTAYHNNVKSILSRMLSFADSLDEFIKLEVKVRELELEVKKLKTQKK